MREKHNYVKCDRCKNKIINTRGRVTFKMLQKMGFRENEFWLCDDCR